MGSGLILFVIVGAWLVVLVPMALRSHDSATSLRSADRFAGAMRVLARRGARDVLVPRREVSRPVRSGGPPPEPARSRTDRLRAAVAPVAARVADRRARVITPAERRRRTLLVLLALSVGSLVGAVAGVTGLLVAQVLSDVLLVAFVLHLRRQAVVRATRRPARPRSAQAATARPVKARPAAPLVASAVAARVAGVPDRMPVRPLPLTAALPAPARRHDERGPLPAAVAASWAPASRGAALPDPASWDEASWSPVPVPPPVYVGKPVAPARRTRVLDLTRPGQWTAALEGEDSGLSILNDGPELDEILDRRRAVNGW